MRTGNRTSLDRLHTPDTAVTPIGGKTHLLVAARPLSLSLSLSRLSPQDEVTDEGWRSENQRPNPQLIQTFPTVYHPPPDPSKQRG